MADYSQQHLDRAAQQQGFKNYQQWQAFQNQRNQIIGAGTNNGTPVGSQPAQQPTNWLQNLMAQIPIHPAYLLGKVNDAFTKAGM